MQFHELELQGAYLIVAEPFQDERGTLRRIFCINEFKKHDIIHNINQANISENYLKYTLRGFHYQREPYSEAKTISLLAGKIYDVIVDLRPISETYLNWISVELSAEKRTGLHIPKGCANAFLTLEDNTILSYYNSTPYTPSAECGIRYCDPFFNFKWPVKPRFVSHKDNNWQDFTLKK